MKRELEKKDESGFSTLLNDDLCRIDGGNASDGKPEVGPIIDGNGNPGIGFTFYK